MKEGPIIIIEDDEDDQEILKQVIKELGYDNTIHFFLNCPAAMEYLLITTQSPFVILCDVNLPKQTGLAFKKQIDETPYLRQKSIPFIFYSTSVDQNTVDNAYRELSIQGFFKKAHSYELVKETIGSILQYWAYCSHPNT